jgi:hypothetical protein
MKCIDAVEGTVKSILNRMHLVRTEDNIDDTEYVRNVKAIIEGTHQFCRENPELVEDPSLLVNVLYTFSRNLWLQSLQASLEQPDKMKDIALENEEYQTYYFDYLYNRGMYPR